MFVITREMFVIVAVILFIIAAIARLMAMEMPEPRGMNIISFVFFHILCDFYNYVCEGALRGW